MRSLLYGTHTGIPPYAFMIHDGLLLVSNLFFVQARMRKLLLVAIYALLVAVDTTALGYSFAFPTAQETVSYLLRVIFDIYLVTLAALTIQDVDVPHHWVAVVHLSTLSILAFAFSFVASILPKTDDVEVYFVEDSDEPRLLVGLWYTNLLLTFLAVMISITTPRGPKLHFPSEAIYSEKTLETSTTHAFDNVCGISGNRHYITCDFI